MATYLLKIDKKIYPLIQNMPIKTKKALNDSIRELIDKLVSTNNLLEKYDISQFVSDPTNEVTSTILIDDLTQSKLREKSLLELRLIKTLVKMYITKLVS